MSEPPVIIRPGDETYLGDGVYASIDSVYQLWLRAERDGREHCIALEPEVFAELVIYARAIRAQLEAAFPPDEPLERPE